jgi:hypothetical protein
MTVTTQSSWRQGSEPRWAYVIHVPGSWPYVSAYRYRTPDGALKAGQRDAEACAALEGELS